MVNLISNYLNGPQTLSDERMSYLVICNPMESIYNDGHNGQFELFMCAPHFIGDGASLHQCTHKFMTLLVSPQSSYDLLQILILPLNWVDLLPPALESRIQIPSSGIARAAAKGGHTLRRTQRSPQKTILIEKSFTESQTKKILAKCEQNGVTVNHALFALCNVAWGQSNLDFKAIREPLMMYTALNLRPFLTPHPSPTYWFVALTYFNIVLPTFVPVTVAAFWNRVRRVKEQTRKVVGTMRGAVERAERVRGGSGAGGAEEPKSINDLLRRDDHDTGTEGTEKLLPPAPSKALFGLSLIGNLDLIYKQEMYGLYPGNKEGEEEEGAVVELALSSSSSVSASTSTPPGTGTTASTTTLSSLSPSPSVYVSAASFPQPGLPYSPPLPADESFPGSDTAALSTTMSIASSSSLPSISTAATSPGSNTSVTSPTTSVTFPHSTSTSTSTSITSPRPSASSASVTSTSTTSASSHLPKIHIQTVTTASRQKPGGFLLLSHTFNKKMWLHLCWDVNGFEEGHVEKFWECLGGCG
ncbi:hypothetical protein D9757_012389 [Collybiopsis confluens]|uniref:Uncharacterized protein n=1 Tax=Collybiopsis confluens TaxID=2823264 RepID=A0A8H5GJ59_9AGAR|nr:hypothetical protein D9757_012389 [Collybiopsis confluens]